MLAQRHSFSTSYTFIPSGVSDLVSLLLRRRHCLAQSRRKKVGRSMLTPPTTIAWAHSQSFSPQSMAANFDPALPPSDCSSTALPETSRAPLMSWTRRSSQQTVIATNATKKAMSVEATRTETPAKETEPYMPMASAVSTSTKRFRTFSDFATCASSVAAELAVTMTIVMKTAASRLQNAPIAGQDHARKCTVLAPLQAALTLIRSSVLLPPGTTPQSWRKSSFRPREPIV
mmetsp:Transcript_1531/g.4514  ORF Transcript_1531/g.4514 Transcript_1531/m.4514 type:complete len:231 (+) Transcript_1531:288-980(+)